MAALVAGNQQNDARRGDRPTKWAFRRPRGSCFYKLGTVGAGVSEHSFVGLLLFGLLLYAPLVPRNKVGITRQLND